VKSSLRLSTRQQLVLTPQMQQTIRMLQLGAKELSEEIDETLSNNPLLTESRSYQISTVQAESGTTWLENQFDQQSVTLEDHLIRQLSFLNLSSMEYVVTCIIITCLDDDGYLRKTDAELVEICASENITTTFSQIQDAVKLIQQLEPAGVGGRNLAECLIAQIKQATIEENSRIAALKICDKLELLAHDKTKLQSEIGDAYFQTAIDLIAGLDPAPGKSYHQQPTIHIQPDVFITVTNNAFSVQLNPVINRGIELNQHYIELLKRSEKQDDKEYLRKNLDKAKWWLNALMQRNKTLQSVVEYMVEHQADYFKDGDSIKIHPLKQQQIADALEIHISTVSRAIRNKYAQSPAGTVTLKQLLATEIKLTNEKTLSNHAVKSIIKNLIKNESSQTPLSDSKIVIELETRGIIIARRTVNKYREQLNIPASNARKVINI